MNLSEKRLFLINELLNESDLQNTIAIPKDEKGQRILLRSLFNIRPPKPISNEFLKIQDSYLKTVLSQNEIIDFSSLTPIKNDIYLFKGDITTLKCDAIVNAANNQLLGCFCPNHSCIDNQIHTFAGVQLRLECNEIMQKQGFLEPTGSAKITHAYNLPCKFILHTVGPIITLGVTEKDKELLSLCYKSCLKLADKNRVESIAFCCISTGEFHFPNELAAKIAIATVNEYKEITKSKIKVIFNVFKQTDYEIYRKLLGQN